MLVIGALLLFAATTFVNPKPGGQAVGVQWIEITTDVPNVDRVDFSVDDVLAGVARKPPYRIAYDFGNATSSRSIEATIYSDSFRKKETVSVRTAALTAGESINVDLVELPLRVRSARTIRADDLRVRENGVEQTIREVRPERAPAHFAFIVDRSLSMGGGKLEAALRAVNDAQSLLRPGDSASLILFNHNVDQPRRVDGLTGLRVAASGGTSLRDAVASIATDERTYAIVITDGGDRNSLMSEEQALRKVSSTKTIVAAAVFGDASRFLERATSNTGGALVDATPQTIAAKVRSIINDINSRYLAVYQSHGTRSGWRTIEVTPKKRDIAITASRKGYFAE